ncbi:hypothetical protein VPH35_140290 [Triticum aestivum]
MGKAWACGVKALGGARRGGPGVVRRGRGARRPGAARIWPLGDATRRPPCGAARQQRGGRAQTRGPRFHVWRLEVHRRRSTIAYIDMVLAGRGVSVCDGRPWIRPAVVGSGLGAGFDGWTLAAAAPSRSSLTS